MANRTIGDIDPAAIGALVLHRLDDLERRFAELKQQQSESTPRLLLRKTEVARALQISTWSLDRWCREGKFPPPIFLQDGSPATWRLKDINSYLDKCRRARRVKRSTRGGTLKQDRAPVERIARKQRGSGR